MQQLSLFYSFRRDSQVVEWWGLQWMCEMHDDHMHVVANLRGRSHALIKLIHTYKCVI